MATHKHREAAFFEIKHIGGIDSTSVSIPEGVTILTGENATNRTSFLQAVMAALGSDRASIKANSDRGTVSLQIDGDTHTRKLHRKNGTVRFDGEPYLDEAETADLFAFLLEDNEARQAVIQQDSLRDIIMQPVDTAAVEDDIKQVEQQRADVDAELDRLDQLADRLPELEARKQELKNNIESIEDELAEKREKLAEREAGVEANKARKAEVEELFDELNDLDSQRERLSAQLESERESLEALEDERKELTAAREKMEPPEAKTSSQFADRLEELRSRKASVESTISRLGQVIDFNEDTLTGDGVVMNELSTSGNDAGSPTDQLLDESMRCWTCGTMVEQSRIEQTLDELRSLRQEHVQERNELRAESEDVSSAKREAEQRREEYNQLERKYERVTGEISDRESTVAELASEIEQVEAKIEDVESEIDDLETELRDDVLEIHSTVNRLEFKREQRADDLEDIQEEIGMVEEELEQRDELESKRTELTEELTSLRTRIERIETEAIEEFNSNMESVLELLDYNNLARIWLERKSSESGGHRGRASRFELHIVREAATGTVYEDMIEHLSESEREVTGLVFALAGYLVHDLHKELPFMLLDSLEAIDSRRLATLIEYFSKYPTYLVVALLPEDATALDESYTRISDI